MADRGADALAVGEEVIKRDINWLSRYEESKKSPVSILQKVSHNSESIIEASDSIEDISYEEEITHIEDEIPFNEEADEALT